MEKAKKAQLPIRKIIGICLILLFVMGVGVMASNAKLNNVKIILSNGYIMNVTTSKTKISEILDENHIILLPEESVIPDEDSELSDNNTIKISKTKEPTVEVAETSEISENVTIDSLLKSYDSIIEKIETVQEIIPYETITKDVSDNDSNKRETVVQQGKDGLKEVTYKVKYQNDVEIERTEISSNIIEEPVDKIIEVRKKVTNRSTRSYSATYSNGVWSYSNEEFDLLCAITAQECSSSYEGALAVITCACNRAESTKWAKNGADPLSQYKAPGQFCYSIDSYWKRRLNGNYSDTVKQAVKDALNGKRNHNYLSFRAAGNASGEYIGGNVYF
ncbi:MAG: G5 domain-containing protein [Clostridia bacterium]